MNEAREDVRAFRHFPPPHRKKVWSTNLLERVNVAPRGVLTKAEYKAPLPRGRLGIFANDGAITSTEFPLASCS